MNERQIQRVLAGIAILLMTTGLGIVGWISLALPETTDTTSAAEMEDRTRESLKILRGSPTLPATLDSGSVQQLAQVRLAKTYTPPQVEPPPPAPVTPLGNLIRIKGIMDYDGPEALIQNISTQRTKSYRVGDLLEAVEAKILKIEGEVLFQYGGQEVSLGVQQQEARVHRMAGSNARPEMAKR
jgi:hypothetical protein